MGQVETNKPEILIVGDPGPAGEPLLARSDLGVLWASRAEEAVVILELMAPKICIISPSIGRQNAQVLFGALKEHPDVPCVVLVAPLERPNVPPGMSPGSVTVIPVDQVDAILGQVSLRTRLPFARDARAAIKLPVLVAVYGERHRLESVNISASGIALKGFPRTAIGTQVQLAMELPSGPFVAAARLVRFSQGTDVAGLEFVDLPPEQRERVAAMVRNYFTRACAPSLVAPVHGDRRLNTQDLFDDLTGDVEASAALRTADVGLPPRDPDDVEATADEIAALRAVLTGAPPASSGAPAWLARIAIDLTPFEVDVVNGSVAPDWARAALQMRVRLARFRLSGKTKLTEGLALDAYRVFLKLAEIARTQPAQAVRHIAKIRASILRDLLATDARGRSGATLPQLRVDDTGTLPRLEDFEPGRSWA